MRPARARGLVGALLTAVMAGACQTSGPARPPEAVACPADAKKANFDFTLKDLAGRNVKLSDFKGRVLLLDFWATWCGPCQVEIPGFIELYDKYRDQGFAAVGIIVEDRFSNAVPFAEAHRMNYPVLDGEERSDLEAAFGPFYGVPTSFIIARDGRICQTHLGLPRTRRSADPLGKAVRDVFEAEIKSLL